MDRVIMITRASVLHTKTSSRQHVIWLSAPRQACQFFPELDLIVSSRAALAYPANITTNRFVPCVNTKVNGC